MSSAVIGNSNIKYSVHVHVCGFNIDNFSGWYLFTNGISGWYLFMDGISGWYLF